MERTVRVDLGPRSYDVRVGRGMLDRLGPVAAAIGGVSSAVVVSDSNVGAIYGRRATESLAGAALPASAIEFSSHPTSEANKDLRTVGRIFDELFEITPPIDRDSLIVALGGGVSGDVAGFVAATALRGLRVLQCPTSLLAAVDSSVGGKTGVDHARGKNLIGAFHQPCCVLIDTDALKTLPGEELVNGLAECVKHAVIRDAALLDFIEDNSEAILNCRADVMADLIARNVAIKAAVVARDERESGVRAHLNFGHTIGHAIEAVVGYDRIRHGQCVSLGMVAANRLAAARGMIAADQTRRIEELLARLGLPVRREGLDADEIWRVVQHDKKIRDRRVRMVLPRAIADVDVFSDITPGQVRSAVEALAP